MPVERVSVAAKTYLAAIGASAIYIATDQGRPISVGVARDLDKALRHLQKIIRPGATFGWVAWGSDYQALTRIAQIPDLIYVNGVDGLRERRQVDDLVVLIQRTASENGVTLTPHLRALERAGVYAAYLDQAIVDMQRNGSFSAFNRAYKAHRVEQQRKGETIPPYWAVMQELRALIIRELIAHPKTRINPALILQQIRKQFPWFTRQPALRKAKRTVNWR